IYGKIVEDDDIEDDCSKTVHDEDSVNDRGNIGDAEDDIGQNDVAVFSDVSVG
ncbi:unnamed protein product, partial [Rotaria socialis]